MATKHTDWFFARVHYQRDKDVPEAKAFETADARIDLWVRAARRRTRGSAAGKLFLANPTQDRDHHRVSGLLCRETGDAKVEEDQGVASLGRQNIATTSFIYFGELDEQVVALAKHSEVWTDLEAALRGIRKVLHAARESVGGAEFWKVEFVPLARKDEFRRFVEEAKVLRRITVTMQGKNVPRRPLKDALDLMREYAPGTQKTKVEIHGHLELPQERIDELDEIEQEGIATVSAKAVKPLPDGTQTFNSAEARRLETLAVEPGADAEEDVEEVIVRPIREKARGEQ